MLPNQQVFHPPTLSSRPPSRARTQAPGQPAWVRSLFTSVSEDLASHAQLLLPSTVRALAAVGAEDGCPRLAVFATAAGECPFPLTLSLPSQTLNLARLCFNPTPSLAWRLCSLARPVPKTEPRAVPRLRVKGWEKKEACLLQMMQMQMSLDCMRMPVHGLCEAD
jgi:hypothetical protein